MMLTLLINFKEDLNRVMDNVCGQDNDIIKI